MADYKTYLAEQVLSDDKIVRRPSPRLHLDPGHKLMFPKVTYRTLSRALKVHVNTAKQ